MVSEHHLIKMIEEYGACNAFALLAADKPLLEKQHKRRIDFLGEEAAAKIDFF
jgi:hypothetical protein